MVGNAHLDPAWMWGWGEGMEAFLATCRSALDRMEEVPGFIFTCSSAAHYRWVEEVEPELFEKIRRKVAEGRWAVVGGWWVQADCNLPSGEGFVRQALLGQRWFREKLGRTARTGYSPDAFGHNLGLPQLLAGAGMDGYIFCRPDPTELELPAPLIRWISPDGSSVLAYRVPFHYNMYESSVPKKVRDLTAALKEASPLAAGGALLENFGAEWSLFYGVGNHGGGPTKEHLREILAIAHDPHQPHLIFSDPDRFLDAVRSEPEARVIPEWRNDLQLNAPGCYSVHSEIKRLNRAAESTLMRAEKIAAMATILTGHRYPAGELRHAWEQVCFNHFHDIICGVAIREALDDAIHDYGEALSIAARAERYGLQAIARQVDTSGPGSTLLVFNPHAWALSEPVTFELWHDIDKRLWSQPVHARILDDRGMDLECTVGFTSGKIGRDRIAITFRATVPPLGWNTYHVIYGEQRPVEEAQASPALTATDTLLENEHLRIEISPEHGGIARLLHRATGTEILADRSALPIAIEDRTDTWGHGVDRFNATIGTFGNAEVRLVEEGPTHATIRSRSRWRGSWVQQDFRLHAGSAELHVDVKLFWAEQYTMLKLGFRSPILRATSINEGAYALVEKQCDGTERPCGSWTAIAGAIGDTWTGVGLATNAKYGFDATSGAEGTELRLSLLRSPSYATHDPHPHHPDEDLDFIDQGIQRFRYTIVPFAGADAVAGLGSGMARSAALLNAPLIPHLESWHVGGELPRSYNGITVHPESVAVTVLKRCEEGHGWIIRLHETNGITTAAHLHLHLLGRSWETGLAPHEVQTWRVGEERVERVDLIEREEPPGAPQRDGSGSRMDRE